MREVVSTKDAPQAIGPYSQAIRANGFVFVSGQVAIDPETQQVIAGDVAAQTDRVLRNLSEILEAADSGLGKVVRSTVFLKNMGDFAAIGHKSFSWVKSHDLIAFYDDHDRSGKDFNKNYGGKTVQLKKGSATFNALIADTCGNNDCDGCCTQNSKHGFLVDMEYWTTLRRIGGPDNADGTIQFKILP